MRNYEPYFVESISEVNEENKYYVFDVISPHSKRNHIVEIYEKIYKYMIPSLLINLKNVDENKYEKYFESLMHKLKETN